jgi:hypothetical protein
VRIKGKVELFTPTAVGGWLATFGTHDDRVELELLLDGIPIAAATADGFRPDVAIRGFGDGACQFEFTLTEPLTRAEAERLQLRIAGSDIYLELPPTSATNDAAALARGPASPVFIVGSPRSGTSVLTRALIAAGYTGFEEGNLLGLAQMIEERVDWYYDTIGVPSPNWLLASVDRADLQDRLFSVFKDSIDRLNRVAPWYDKTGNPETILLLPRIMRAWPGARVVFARRRGIENVLSRLQKFPDRDFDYHCADWAANMRAWRLTRDRLDPARIIEIDQSDMLAAPDAVAECLAALLRLPEQPRAALAETFRTDRPQESFPGSAARHPALDGTGWTAEQIATFREVCGEEMRLYGYDLA